MWVYAYNATLCSPAWRRCACGVADEAVAGACGFTKTPASVQVRAGSSATFCARLTHPEEAANVWWTVNGRLAASCPRCQVRTTITLITNLVRRFATDFQIFQMQLIGVSIVRKKERIQRPEPQRGSSSGRNIKIQSQKIPHSDARGSLSCLSVINISLWSNWTRVPSSDSVYLLIVPNVGFFYSL